MKKRSLLGRDENANGVDRCRGRRGRLLGVLCCERADKLGSVYTNMGPAASPEQQHIMEGFFDDHPALCPRHNHAIDLEEEGYDDRRVPVRPSAKVSIVNTYGRVHTKERKRLKAEGESTLICLEEEKRKRRMTE